MITAVWRSGAWSLWHMVAAALLMAVAGAITSDAWADIGLIAWCDEEASHILLVPVVVAWLVWVRRRRPVRCRPTGQWVGVILVAIGWPMYSWGDSGLVQMLWHGGAVLIVTGCLVTVVGAEVLLYICCRRSWLSCSSCRCRADPPGRGTAPAGGHGAGDPAAV